MSQERILVTVTRDGLVEVYGNHNVEVLVKELPSTCGSKRHREFARTYVTLCLPEAFHEIYAPEHIRGGSWVHTST